MPFQLAVCLSAADQPFAFLMPEKIEIFLNKQAKNKGKRI